MSEKIKRVTFGTPIEPATFVYSSEFMIGNHNYLCAVCRDNHAVWDMNSGLLEPCRKCHSNGYRLVKTNWFQRIFL